MEMCASMPRIFPKHFQRKVVCMNSYASRVHITTTYKLLRANLFVAVKNKQIILHFGANISKCVFSSKFSDYWHRLVSLYTRCRNTYASLEFAHIFSKHLLKINRISPKRVFQANYITYLMRFTSCKCSFFVHSLNVKVLLFIIILHKLCRKSSTYFITIFSLIKCLNLLTRPRDKESRFSRK